jgi:hypothetical protein
MSEVKIVGRDVDTLVLNVTYADKQFQPIKQELNADLQEELNSLQGEARINESPVVTKWAFKGFSDGRKRTAAPRRTVDDPRTKPLLVSNVFTADDRSVIQLFVSSKAKSRLGKSLPIFGLFVFSVCSCSILPHLLKPYCS